MRDNNEGMIEIIDAFKEGDEPLGISHLQKSAALSVSNNKQKALSYLRLGELFYDKPLYIESQAYYDSCLIVLPEDYSQYEKIYDRTKALTRLVKNILIVQLQDSLQRLANDENYRDKIVGDLVSNAIREEEERKAALENDNEFSTFNNNSSTSLNLPNSGKWYFYNTTTLGFGFTDFRKIWGERKFEDNWRRSSDPRCPTERPTTNHEEPRDQGRRQPGNRRTCWAYSRRSRVYVLDFRRPGSRKFHPHPCRRRGRISFKQPAR